MKKSRLTNFSASLCLFSLLFLSDLTTRAWSQTTSSGGQAPSYQLTGEAGLLSHFVHHGLSQTNQDPSLQGSFWFNFGPQFRLGVWGSNTNFEGSDIHLWLRFSADIKVDFTENAQLRIAYSQNQFYKSSLRNGNTLALDLNLFTYHIIYELESNWDGTSTTSTYYAFQKTFDIFSSWQWSNQVGYSIVTAAGYESFFDLKTGLGTQFNNVNMDLSVTGTSAASQFNGRGDYFVIASLRSTFK